MSPNFWKNWYYTKFGLVIPFISNNPSLREAEAASEAWREAKQSQRLGDCFAELAMTIKRVVKTELLLNYSHIKLVPHTVLTPSPSVPFLAVHPLE